MYKKYDQSIIDTVIKTQNIHVFPELKIPRTTALYWINQSKNRVKPKRTIMDKKKQQIDHYQEILRIENIKILFLRAICLIYTKRFSKNEENEKVIEVISNYKRTLSINLMCKLIQFNDKLYYQHLNKAQQISYTQKKSNQLTKKEQTILIELSKSEKLKHLSVKQLQLHAFRENLLHCHYDTWRRYINLFYPERKRLIRQEKAKRIKELVYSRPHQAWHIDVTYFKGINGTHIYAQFIIDSYSRAIIAFKVSSKRNSCLTGSTLRLAIKRYKPKFLICDAGGENLNSKVSELLRTVSILRVVATGRNKHLNSRIEAFFNTIKSRYLNKYKVYTEAVLESSIRKIVKKYNNAPLALYYGATPNEVLSRNINFKFLKEELNRKREYARIERKKNFNHEVINSRASGS